MTDKTGTNGIASMIDHTILKPDASVMEIEQICDQACQYHFWSVCVNSCHVRLCKKKLQGSGVKVCSVVGFPLGAMSTAAKAFEASRAVADGASEIDMVINVGFVKSKKIAAVRTDIKAVLDACADIALKVIIETGLLSDEQKILCCEICRDLGVSFVKTSTGFGHGGATIKDVMLMRKTVGPDIGVKASGGVRSLETAIEMIEAGATRLGTSSGVAIVREEALQSGEGV